MKLSEMAFQPTTIVVDYYAITPSGSSSRFQRRTSMSNIRGNPRSETAVLAYLRKLHPKCEIQIQSLDFE